MNFTKAVRKSVPMLISLSGTSGSGKTYSGLLLAAGLAGPEGRVGFIDTENGRGSMYADSPGITKALPRGYEIGQFDPPFSPERYVAAITAAEQSGINVLVIDSFSHEWEGIGGACEIAETKRLRGMPNWAAAKLAHKRCVNHCLSSQMHIVFCLRARDKVKIEKVGGREEIIPIGIQPICEKNFVFEMLISILLDEKTHHALPLKVPEPLAHLFPRDGSRVLTVEDGARIRQWNETGREFDISEQIRKRARLAAEGGVAEYRAFFSGLSKEERKSIGDSAHAENKKAAEEADRGSVLEFDTLPEDAAAFDPYTVISVKGEQFTNGEEMTGWSRVKGA